MPAEPAPQYFANLHPLDPLLIVAGLERRDHMVARYPVSPIAMLPDQGVRCRALPSFSLIVFGSH